MSFLEDTKAEIEAQEKCARILVDLPNPAACRCIRWLVMSFVMQDEAQVLRLVREIRLLTEKSEGFPLNGDQEDPRNWASVSGFCENTDDYGAPCNEPGRYYEGHGYLCPDCAGDYDLPES